MKNTFSLQKFKKFPGVENAKRIYFTQSKESAKDALDQPFDISEDNDNSVLIYYVANAVVVASEEKVKSPDSLFEAFFGFDVEEFDFRGLDTSGTRDFCRSFSCCYNLTRLDLSMLDMSGAEDISRICEGCVSLRKILFPNEAYRAPKHLQNMKASFKDCKALLSINMETIITDDVRDMSELCKKDNNLRQLNFSCFHTPMLEDISDAFYQCYRLYSLDLSHCDFQRTERKAHLLYGVGLLSKNCVLRASSEQAAVFLATGTDMDSDVVHLEYLHTAQQN